jgi:tRNA 2-selenouridine synthase
VLKYLLLSTKVITPQNWLEMDDRPPLLDVRSPGEFAQGHWPEAKSLPLFSDEERAEVGTLYKQTNQDAAFLRGLEFSGQKMRWYVEEARRLAPDNRLAVHCWRGGQRSQSIAWLLSKVFGEVLVIEGGYKALRNTGREQLANFSTPLVILGGPTGSGKTKILHALRDRGGSMVDLEHLAHHKGSAFGALGEIKQPTVEQFENDLFHRFQSLRETEGPIWLENESQAIGRVYLPKELWHKMMAAPLVQLDIPLEWRVQNLVEDYASYPKADLIESFERIRKRLGGQHLQTALLALETDDFSTAAAIALQYYDKAYHHSLNKNGQQKAWTFKPETNDAGRIAEVLMERGKGLVS